MPDCPAKAGEVDDATLDGLGVPRHSDLIHPPHGKATKSRRRRGLSGHRRRWRCRWLGPDWSCLVLDPHELGHWGAAQPSG
jgi:hypothetical protein